MTSIKLSSKTLISIMSVLSKCSTSWWHFLKYWFLLSVFHIRTLVFNIFPLQFFQVYIPVQSWKILTFKFLKLYSLGPNTSKLCIVLVLICLDNNWKASKTSLFKNDFLHASLDIPVNCLTVSQPLKQWKLISALVFLC